MEGKSHHLPSNLKVLRILRKQNQDQMAFNLGAKRSTYASWENGACEPCLDQLLAMGAYHRLSLDILLAKDLRLMRMSQIEELQRAY